MSGHQLPEGVEIGLFYGFGSPVGAYSKPANNKNANYRWKEISEGELIGIQERNGYLIVRGVPLGMKQLRDFEIPPGEFCNATVLEKKAAA